MIEIQDPISGRYHEVAGRDAEVCIGIINYFGLSVFPFWDTVFQMMLAGF